MKAQASRQEVDGFLQSNPFMFSHEIIHLRSIIPLLCICLPYQAAEIFGNKWMKMFFYWGYSFVVIFHFPFLYFSCFTIFLFSRRREKICKRRQIIRVVAFYILHWGYSLMIMWLLLTWLYPSFMFYVHADKHIHISSDFFIFWQDKTTSTILFWRKSPYDQSKLINNQFSHHFIILRYHFHWLRCCRPLW